MVTLGKLSALERRIAVVTASHIEMHYAMLGFMFMYGDEIPGCVTGPGGQRAADAIDRLLAEENVHGLILAGFSGGLDPTLKLGDLVRPRWVTNEDGQTYELHDDAPPTPLTQQSNVQEPTILTVSRLVATPRKKRALCNQWQASCVDMESFHVAEVAAKHGIPLRIIRAISDAATETLPEVVTTWLTRFGRTNTTAIVRYILTHPWRLSLLLKLKRSAAVAGGMLCDAVLDDWRKWAYYNHILLFGGAFDPPQNAHVKLPELVRQAIGADVVAYIPAAQPPLKTFEAYASPQDRLAMLRLALKDQPHAIVLTDEIERGGESYTVDTLLGLRDRVAKEAKLRLLIGADHARQFICWRDWRKIVELAEPVIMLRPPETRESLLASLPSELNRNEWAERIVDVPVMEGSSTEVRRRVANGESVDKLVPNEVERYIRERGLYGFRPSLQPSPEERGS